MVRKNLPVLIEELGSIDGLQNLAMTTNATLLQPYAKRLRQAGLSSLNISLDTLHADRFMQITRRDDLENVLGGIKAALAVGFPSLKLNVVVMSGINDDEVLDFVEFVKDTRINVRFIEYMPFKSNGWQLDKVVTYQDLKARIEKVYRLIPIDTEPSAVAKDFAIAGHSGSVSFISSMSDSFCGTCNRLRLTSMGSIKSCLFYPAEMSLKEALRGGVTDGELVQMIMEALAMKPEAHPPAEEILAEDNRAMIEIGG
jgi:cyclic pyranopterin phosphate synthase